MSTALLEELPEVEGEVGSASPRSEPPPPEALPPVPDITFLSVIRFVVGTIAGGIYLALQLLVEATAVLLIPFAPFLLLLLVFPLIFLVALIIMAGGAVLTAFGLV